MPCLIAGQAEKQTTEQVTTKNVYTTCQNWDPQKISSPYKSKLIDISFVQGQMTEKWNQHFAQASHVYAVNTKV